MRRGWSPALVRYAMTAVPPSYPPTESHADTAVARGVQTRSAAELVRAVIFGLAVAGSLFSVSAGPMMNSMRAIAWPTTTGTVIESELTRSPHGRYLADVTYRYTVEGTVYYGERVQFGDDGGFEPIARLIVETFPVHRQIVVRFDPEDPDESVLWLSLPALTWLLFVFGVLATASSLSALVLYYRGRRLRHRDRNFQLADRSINREHLR